MRVLFVLIAVIVVTLIAGCASPNTRQTLVFGESFASTAEAVQEARLAIERASALGCNAISVGSGGAGAAVEQGGGLVLNVVVLLECPPGTPDILAATGNPVP